MADLYPMDKPITIFCNEKHEYFDRKIAVKEGYRENEEIRASKHKRPFPLARKWQLDYLFSNVDIFFLKPSLIKGAFEQDERAGKTFQKLVEKITNPNNIMGISELDKYQNLKDKTIFVYVEKYSDDIYTVREDMFRDSQVIAKLYCKQFYGIVGEFMIINFDKVEGEYIFKNVIPSYKYYDNNKK